MKDQYIIIDPRNIDFMKDKDGKINYYDTEEDACLTCGMYEFENALVMKLIYARELREDERINILHTRYGNKGHHIEAGFNMLDEYNIPTKAFSLMWNQRSVDSVLGLPFNNASYALLLEILTKEVNMVPDELISNLGDTRL